VRFGSQEEIPERVKRKTRCIDPKYFKPLASRKVKVAWTSQVAEKKIHFVIPKSPRRLRNLSSIQTQAERDSSLRSEWQNAVSPLN
jgi:hypothetical protein